MLDFINPVKIYQNTFGSSTPELAPICETTDLLCRTLEGYGLELHSPEMLVNTAQGLSDMTGMSEGASYLTVAAGTLASTVAAIYGVTAAVKNIMKPSDEKIVVKPFAEDLDSIKPVSLTDEPITEAKKEQPQVLILSGGASSSSHVDETPVVVRLKHSHAELVDKYINQVHKEAVAKMTGAVLTAFNELSLQTVRLFGKNDSNSPENVLKFNKLTDDEKIGMLGNMERLVQARLQESKKKVTLK